MGETTDVNLNKFVSSIGTELGAQSFVSRRGRNRVECGKNSVSLGTYMENGSISSVLAR